MISNHRYFHWLYYNQKKHPFFNFGAGLFVWLFLALTLPFGMYDNNVSSKILLLLVLLPYGLFWPLISYSVDFLCRKVFSLNAHENYRRDFWVLISKLFLLVHVNFLVRNILSNWSDFYWSEYFEHWLGSILLVSLVYIPFSLYARYKFFHNMVGQGDTGLGELFELRGEGKSSLRISLDKIIYIKSDDNYLDIVTLDQDETFKTIVFRARLKSVEEQLSGYSQFFRVHRSFILNIQFLTDVNKSDSLKVKHGEEEIELPISRKYRQDLLRLLK